MPRWIRPLRVGPKRGNSSRVWITLSCYNQVEIERTAFAGIFVQPQLLRGVHEDSCRGSLSRANGTLDITVPDGRGLGPCPMDPPKWCLPIRATGGPGTRASHPCITTTRPRLGHPAMINVLHNLFGLWSKETRQAV